MAIQSEQVAHKDLVGGAETTLHSHAGGGNGPEYEAGQSTGTKGETKQVNFGSTFSSIPRVLLTPWSEHIVNLVSVSTTSFQWINNSKNVDVIVDWMAMV